MFSAVEIREPCKANGTGLVDDARNCAVPNYALRSDC